MGSEPPVFTVTRERFEEVLDQRDTYKNELKQAREDLNYWRERCAMAENAIHRLSAYADQLYEKACSDDGKSATQ